MHMDQHMMDGNNQMMPQDGMGPNNGQYMYQNCQNQMMDGMGPNNGQLCLKRANASCKVNLPKPQGGNKWYAPQPTSGTRCTTTTQNLTSILLIPFSHNTFRERGHESAFMATIEATHSM